MGPTGWLWTTMLAAPLVGFGYLASRPLSRRPTGLTAALLAWAWLTLGMQVLGACGLLSRWPLLAWGWGGFALLILARPVLAVRESAAPDENAGAWDAPATIAVGLTIWVGLVYGIRSLLLPVKVVSDGPIYHLYFAARWWKEARLSLIASPFGESAATYFPANGDLWFSWLMIGWGGDRLARVGQAPFLWLSALTAHAMARRLGAGRAAATLAVTWFVTCMPILVYSFEPNVDSIFLAGYLLACHFLLRYALGDDGLGAVALAGLAAGAAWGTKPTGLVFIPILLAAGAWLVLWKEDRWKARLRGFAYLGGSCLVLTGFWFGRDAWLTGNPLYPMHLEIFGQVVLRGWYPTSAMRWSRYFIPREQWAALADILLMVLDPRLAPVWLAALVGLWAVGRRSSRALDRWVWLATVLALANVALYWLVIPYRTQQRFMLQAIGLAVVPLARLFERGRGWRWAGALLLGTHLLTAQNWPFERAVRLAWLRPEVPNVLRDVPTPAALIPIPWSILAGVGSDLGTWFARLVPISGSLALGVGALALAWLWSRRGRRGQLLDPWKPIVATIALAALAGLSLEFGPGSSPIRPSERFYPDFPDYQRAWQVFDRATRQHPGRVAYAGTDLPYYLLGKDLRNEVRYVNVDDHPTWLMHDYQRTAADRGDPTLWETPRPGWDRLHPDLHAWLANLQRAGIDWLVVARAKPEEGLFNIADADQFPIERTWAESLPDRFRPIHGVRPPDPEMRVYRVLPEKKSDGSQRAKALTRGRGS